MIVKIVGVAVLVCFAVLITKQNSAKTAGLISCFAGIIIFVFSLKQSKEFLEYFIKISSENEYGDYFVIMVKALGVAIITAIGADFCRDCSEETLACRVEFAGKAELLLLALPLLKNLIEISEELLIN